MPAVEAVAERGSFFRCLILVRASRNFLSPRFSGCVYFWNASVGRVQIAYLQLLDIPLTTYPRLQQAQSPLQARRKFRFSAIPAPSQKQPHIEFLPPARRGGRRDAEPLIFLPPESGNPESRNETQGTVQLCSKCSLPDFNSQALLISLSMGPKSDHGSTRPRALS